MAKKARQRISYVLPLVGNQSGGHRLGVNGLAIDRDNAILYSGGRDGVVCAWDLNLDLKNPESQAAASNATANGAAAKSKSTTTFRAQTQAHTHWINDLALAQNHTALISASSDLTVKVWRPHGNARAEPVTIGQHADYVKSVVAPDQQSDWVASGGLDRKIYLWDLNGKGEKLHIDVSGEEITEKGSVYALAATHNMLASGGPESVVRLWDPRTGKNITKFVGHTDNVRAILVNEPGDMILTASSDQTVKVWSVTAGRCMHTLTMHNDSVWTLFSDQPDLGIFYSGDRSGLVVKTDVRGTLDEMDDGISLAVAQEQESVSKVVACGGHIWTTTSSSSINRWEDVDTGADIALPEALRQHRASISTQVSASRPREASPPAAAAAAANGAPAKKEIPAKAVLRISNTARFPAPLLASEASVVAGSGITRKGSEVLQDASSSEIVPIHHLPEETIEGQFGLVKHRLLNDRRRVLTLDTAGEVLLWDLIQCKPIQNFGKKHLEDVEPEVNTLEAVAPWCSVDTSSGSLTVVLEPYNCFDAEMYADELVLDEPVEFREDQRINLGKWILRYLFAKLIDEEIKRDEAHRAKINEGVEARIAAAAANPPPPITIPPPNMDGWDQGDGSATTPRANGASYPPTTPGMGIGVVTPGAPPPGTPGTPLERRQSHLSRPSTDKDDYFSSNAISSAEQAKPAVTPAETAASTDKEGKTSMENGKDKEKEKEKEKEKDNGKTASTPFGKKFRMGMGMSFGSKKLGRSASSTAPEKPAVVDEKTEERSESSSNHEKEVDDSFLGTIQKIHNEYDKLVLEAPDKPVETRVVPSLASETPVLKLPPATKVIIQEETSGGSAELYRGTVETVGLDADVIEHKGPMWLGEVLLTNSVPPKEPVKVSFILHPWQDALPSLSVTDGNNRLNANRMLRVKKILSYIAERIEPAPPAGGGGDDPDALKPEEYLELYCNEQLLPITMSLATLRAHVWKGGNDIVLYYKANGRKEIPNPPPPIEPAVPEEPEQEAEAEAEAAAAAASSAPPAQAAAPVTA